MVSELLDLVSKLSGLVSKSSGLVSKLLQSGLQNQDLFNRSKISKILKL